MTSVHYMQLRRYTIVTLKYLLATAFGFYLAEIIAPEELLSITFIAVLSLQPNLYRGLKYAGTQFAATTMATLLTSLVILGLQFDLYARPTIWTTALAMGLTILFCLRLGLGEGTVVALFTVTYLAAIPLLIDTTFVHGIFLRYLTIVVGVGVAALFNFLSSLFRYRDRLFLHLVEGADELETHLKQIMQSFKSEQTGLPERSELKDFLNQFGTIFSSLRSLRQDLDEIDREIRFFGREKMEVENQIYRSFLNILNDISHYSWDLILNLMNYELHDETERLIKRHIREFHADLVGSIRRLREKRPRKSSIAKKINKRIDELNREMNKAEPDSSEIVAPLMGLYSDLVHINLNLLQFEKQLIELSEHFSSD